MIHEPKLSDEQKREIHKRAVYTQVKGGTVSCGHDFWDKAKEIDFGDTILCSRCSQYFVKIKNLVWWVGGDDTRPPHSNHLDGVWFHPVKMRLQDRNGNGMFKR